MLRIDDLAQLGCCCFCSILYIANDDFVQKNPEKVRAFMRAVKRAADDLFKQPQKAWEDFQRFKKSMSGNVNARIFERSFAYMSRDCANGELGSAAWRSKPDSSRVPLTSNFSIVSNAATVPRDWSKVTNYCKRLGIIDDAFEPNDQLIPQLAGREPGRRGS